MTTIPEEIQGMPIISAYSLSLDMSHFLSPAGMKVSPMAVVVLDAGDDERIVCHIRWSTVLEQWRIRDDMHVWHVGPVRAVQMLADAARDARKLADTARYYRFEFPATAEKSVSRRV